MKFDRNNPIEQMEFEDRCVRFLDSIFGEGTSVIVGWQGESFEELGARVHRQDINAWWKSMRGREWPKGEHVVAKAARGSSKSRRKTR